jgi:nitrogen fixation/metabolism regulation signal transduction histidine kinase
MIGYLSRQIVHPLENLLGVIKAIEEDDLDVSVASSFDRESIEYLKFLSSKEILNLQ